MNGYEANQNRTNSGYKAYQNCFNSGYEANQNRTNKGTSFCLFLLLFRRTKDAMDKR